MYVIVNDENDLEIYAEDRDLCYFCSNMDVCPLLSSVQGETVVLRYEGIYVDKCGIFKDISACELMKCLDR
jgi:hypothetical protein